MNTFDTAELICYGNATYSGNGTSSAALANSTSKITVKGNLICTGTGACYGAVALGSSQIIVDGTITVPATGTYIWVGGVSKTKEQYEPTSTRPGYREYKNGSAIVWVKNPADPVWLALTVVSGSGGGSYLAGTAVPISANAAPAGKVFDKWVLTSGSGTIADANSAATTFTMGTGAATVTATYKNAPPSAKYIKLWGKVTKYLDNFGNWLLVIFCFGWIWMAF